MFQMKILIRAGRRAVGALLALALPVGLLGLASPAASADPDRSLTVHDWVIDDLLNGGQDPHQEYWNMIAAMHRVTGHDFFRDTLDETTTNGNALFQVSIHRYGTYVGALYFWTNDLYLAGFYQAGAGGGHYAFNESRRARFDQVLGVHSTALPWNGSYTNFSDWAGDQGRRRHIRNDIRVHGSGGAQMGEENVDLQQNWGSISNWTYRVLQNPGVRPLQIGTGAFLRTFATLQQLIAYVLYMELASGSRPR